MEVMGILDNGRPALRMMARLASMELDLCGVSSEIRKQNLTISKII